MAKTLALLYAIHFMPVIFEVTDALVATSHSNRLVIEAQGYKRLLPFIEG